MVAVIFELRPNEGRTQAYFDLAARLLPRLKEMDGFVSIERFESVSEPGKFLSLSVWRDEKAVEVWRNTAAHRIAQAQGRAGIFKDYRLRVAGVIRDYGMSEREQAPQDSRAIHG